RRASSRSEPQLLLPDAAFRGTVAALDVTFEVFWIEVHGAQIAIGVALHLIGEVFRIRVPARAADAHRQRAHARSELDRGDETVASSSVIALGSRILLGAEGGERAPSRGGERHRRARLRIIERLHDGAIVALEAVDLTPRHLPA